MQTKTKLMVLELIAGLFGWIWIIAFIAALYFLAVAIFSGGPWSRFFWALGLSAIAKWLLRGFNDNKQRVAFEAKLIADGYTREEAGEEWASRYLESRHR
jgi:hypothetical protein